jgi:hypothetical protein
VVSVKEIWPVRRKERGEKRIKRKKEEKSRKVKKMQGDGKENGIRKG